MTALRRRQQVLLMAGTAFWQKPSVTQLVLPHESRFRLIGLFRRLEHQVLSPPLRVERHARPKACMAKPKKTANSSVWPARPCAMRALDKKVGDFQRDWLTTHWESRHLPPIRSLRRNTARARSYSV
jgi:hypothetical protein